MTVDFYYNESDPIKLWKKLNHLKTLSTVELKEPSSLLNPTIIISYTDFSSLLSDNFNYVFITELNRFYFIGNPTILTGGRVEIPCSVDVLQSFNTEIIEVEGYLTRQGKGTYWYSGNSQYKGDASRYLPDSTIPIKTKVFVDNIQFSKTPFSIPDDTTEIAGGSTTPSFLLTVIGGAHS